MGLILEEFNGKSRGSDWSITLSTIVTRYCPASARILVSKDRLSLGPLRGTAAEGLARGMHGRTGLPIQPREDGRILI